MSAWWLAHWLNVGVVVSNSFTQFGDCKILPLSCFRIIHTYDTQERQQNDWK